ncbi:MAG: hypothetical protein ACREFN_08815, partial [Acetobacteraceae bacterium]
PHPPAPAAAEDARATLLIADDNADMRAYLRRLLGTRYRVRAAADGATARRPCATRAASCSGYFRPTAQQAFIQWAIWPG